ncbi:TPM domain-containing protein [Rudanella paleaurantiibacter]|uniref:TPM domain-containing protein n=1 Tax=Rudanella paleaurantiibacter TaxID=2614655 RepID=A0A7J5TXW4_9BACT|nr:TPM domain-containing protein [Rudanella paleaurantiibacter]KAB7729411.1 TPM domain-containing protein [Rudanella paleaurantiibacter]
MLLTVSTAVRAQTGNPNDVIPNRPNPPRLVNDYVGILQPGERAILEEKLRRYNDSTSTQITLVIVKTTEPYPIGDFAFQVGRKWGVGQKGKNNGLVLAWATGDRKIYIATGYGLEGAIPDAVANRIVDNIIVPAFKQQQYFQGLDAATTEIIKRAQGEYKSEPANEDGGGDIFVWIFLILVVIILFSWINRRGGGNRYRGGGGGGWFIPYTTYTGWGSSSGSWGGGGGGGGSDFGGFGGGSFGGGGAGGDY